MYISLTLIKLALSSVSKHALAPCLAVLAISESREEYKTEFADLEPIL